MSILELETSDQNLNFLLSPAAIRQQCMKVFTLAVEGKSHFILHLDEIPKVADYVFEVLTERYPQLEIPGHSCWVHLKESTKRQEILASYLDTLDNEERLKFKIDFATLVSVIGAGTGSEWSFEDKEEGIKLGRTEGLVCAAFDLMMSDLFKTDGLYQLNAQNLLSLEVQSFTSMFQISEKNKLYGIEGRLSLLNQLGYCLENNNSYFDLEQRPGDLLNTFKKALSAGEIEAYSLFHSILKAFHKIWPSRLNINGVSMGDTWLYKPIGTSPIEQILPFHTLSQFMVYSYFSAIEDYGWKIVNKDSLSGLSDYRNSGLFVDLGVLELRDIFELQKLHLPSDNIILEWRALSVVLLDQLAKVIRDKMTLDSQQFPLWKILEAGSWHAGRKIAYHIRANGEPPLKIQSQGMVI